MKPKNTLNKLFTLAGNYMHIIKISSIKGKYNVALRPRNLDHLNFTPEIKKVPIPLSFTLGNLIVDQKIGRII